MFRLFLFMMIISSIRILDICVRGGCVCLYVLVTELGVYNFKQLIFINIDVFFSSSPLITYSSLRSGRCFASSFFLSALLCFAIVVGIHWNVRFGKWKLNE